MIDSTPQHSLRVLVLQVLHAPLVWCLGDLWANGSWAPALSSRAEREKKDPCVNIFTTLLKLTPAGIWLVVNFNKWTLFLSYSRIWWSTFATFLSSGGWEISGDQGFVWWDISDRMETRAASKYGLLKLLKANNLSPLASNLWHIFIMWSTRNIWNMLNTFNLLSIWNIHPWYIWCSLFQTCQCCKFSWQWKDSVSSSLYWGFLTAAFGAVIYERLLT